MEALMMELTQSQRIFLAAVEGNLGENVQLLLTNGNKELLCVIGKAARMALSHPDRELFELLTNTGSSLELIREYHAAKVAPWKKEEITEGVV
jgi:hypothetical protein